MAKCRAIDSAFSFYPIFGKLAGKQDMRQSFLPLFLRQLKLRWAIVVLLGSLFTKCDQKLIYSSAQISAPKIKAVAQIVLEISILLTRFPSHISKGAFISCQQGFNVKNCQKLQRVITLLKFYRLCPKVHQVIHLFPIQYTKYPGPSSNSFQDILLTWLNCWKFQRAVTPSKCFAICAKVNKIIYS